jgi:hypothetical protein
MSILSKETRISKQFTVGDWLTMRAVLLEDLKNNGDNKEAWESASAVLQDRVKTRFISPIQWILEKDINSGEGFSAVALQCILVEFLEALYQGKVYAPKKREERFHFEYNSSSWLFRSFIRNRPPFCNYFNTEDKVNSFYNAVRCGLIHQAATMGAVLIRKGGPNNPLVEFVDDKPEKMILYRSNFQSALEEWLLKYREDLLLDVALKRNFIRKMDDICGIERVVYFAYGSNMLSERLIQRIGKFHRGTKAKLEGYTLVYNKKSIDGSAKANIEECNGGEVFGVCYEIDKSDFLMLSDIEKGYVRCKVSVMYPSERSKFRAYTFLSNSITEASPKPDYVEMVRSGAKEWEIDDGW